MLLNISRTPLLCGSASGEGWQRLGTVALMQAGHRLFALALSYAPLPAADTSPVARQHRLALLKLCCYIALWFCFSISLTLYNKWLFVVFGLHFPLLITSMHFSIKILLARLTMRCLGLRAPDFSSLKRLLVEVIPTGMSTAGDVAMSNLSLLYITITYYTVIKSSVPFWILLFSIAYGIQRPRADIVLVLLMISSGIAIASLEEDESVGSIAHDSHTHADDILTLAADANGTHMLDPLGEMGGAESLGGGDSHRSLLLLLRGRALSVGSRGPDPFLGFVLVLGASVCAGFRWACMQVLLTRRQIAAMRKLESAGVLESEGRVDGEEDVASSVATTLVAERDPPDRHTRPFISKYGAAAAGAPAGARAPATLACEGLHPVTLLYLISPFAALTLLPFSISIEGPALLARVAETTSGAELCKDAALACSSVLLAFGLHLSEMRVVQLSSGLTLSVAGIFKEVLTVLSSCLLLGERLTPYNSVGLSLCLLGIAQYHRIKSQEAAAGMVAATSSYATLNTGGGDTGGGDTGGGDTGGGDSRGGDSRGGDSRGGDTGADMVTDGDGRLESLGSRGRLLEEE